MSAALSIELVRHALFVCLLVAAPLLVTELVVGVVVSIVQAVTQIQEQTLTFVPKLLALGVVTLITLPWILRQLSGYIADAIRSLPTVVG
jgi:flagellar biosynthetic protein FliQ